VRGSGGGGRGRPATLPQAALHWEQLYAAGERPWGEGPSELARLVVARLGSSPAAGRTRSSVTLLDVGCGYGRDSRYLARELGCAVVGIDPSPAAITAARATRRRDLDVEFLTADPMSLAAVPEHAGRYDVLFAGQVYHLLGPMGRREFAASLAALAPPGGLLFLSALSPRDPEHYAVGRPVSGEARSWVDKVYLHFCTAEELGTDFAAFDLLDLDERSYEEPRPGGRPHHHTSWFLEGRRSPQR
jgi:SAM-dependent methyltransferase